VDPYGYLNYVKWFIRDPERAARASNTDMVCHVVPCRQICHVVPAVEVVQERGIRDEVVDEDERRRKRCGWRQRGGERRRVGDGGVGAGIASVQGRS